jgi:hypothetical protein
VDVGHWQVFAVSQSNQLHAGWQNQVGQVQDGADFNFSHVHFDELWQIAWQARNFNFHGSVGNFAALHFHANRSFLVGEVQWYVSSQFLAGYNANEVSVHHEHFNWVTLQRFDQYGFNRAVYVQSDYVAESSLVFEQFGDVFSDQADRLSAFLAAVDYGWDQAGETT